MKFFKDCNGVLSTIKTDFGLTCFRGADNLWRVYSEDLTTLINSTGYDELSPTVFGFIIAKFSGYHGLIDNSGKLIIPCLFEEIRIISRPGNVDQIKIPKYIIFTYINNKWGLWNNHGKNIIPTVYSEIVYPIPYPLIAKDEIITEPFILAKRNDGKETLFDFEGICVIGFLLDKVSFGINYLKCGEIDIEEGSYKGTVKIK